MQRAATWLVLLGFGGFSVWVVATSGYFGFLELAAREPWALQMLLDLVISLALVLRWLIPDARQRGQPAWPWVLGTLALGSLAPLLYAALRPTGASSVPRKVADRVE